MKPIRMRDSVERVLDIDENGGRMATEIEIILDVLCAMLQVGKEMEKGWKCSANFSSLLRITLSLSLCDLTKREKQTDDTHDCRMFLCVMKVFVFEFSNL